MANPDVANKIIAANPIRNGYAIVGVSENGVTIFRRAPRNDYGATPSALYSNLDDRYPSTGNY